MAPRTSQAMLDAMKLIEAGVKPYAASKATGITRGAISLSPLYRAWKAAQTKETPK